MALTEALPVRVKVQLAVLLPPLEQAPDQMALRPLDTVSVTLPVASEADAELPTATLIPAGLELTLSPLRPLAVTVSVALVAGAAAGFSVKIADWVTPPPETEMVTSVCAVTSWVITLNPPAVVPAGMSTEPGTLTAGLLLLTWNIWSTAAAAASLTVANEPVVPVTEVGLSAMEAGWPCGVRVRGA